MYAVTVSFTLRPGARADFLPLMAENARLSLQREAGCRQFDVCTDGGEETEGRGSRRYTHERISL